MSTCPHAATIPAAFELQTTSRVLRFSGRDGVFAAASTFGGRWRVTGADGRPLFSLAPCGPAGSDDRSVVPHDGQAVATIMRDRRHVGTWVVLDESNTIVLRACAGDAYDATLTDADGVLTGHLWSTATAVTVDFGAPSGLHCVAMALPLYFATTGALKVEPLLADSPLALAGDALALEPPRLWD